MILRNLSCLICSSIGTLLLSIVPSSEGQDVVPLGGGGTPIVTGNASTLVSTGTVSGFDHIPTAEAAAGLGFFTSHYIPPVTDLGWRVGVRYTPEDNERPLEYWALVTGGEWLGETFDARRVSAWSVDIHEGINHFIAHEHGDVYHAEQSTWDHGSDIPYATNWLDLPIHLIGFDVASDILLEAGVEYVFSVAILQNYNTNGFGGIHQFPGTIPSAVQVSEQLEQGWHFTSEALFNRFSGGVSTRLVSTPLDTVPVITHWGLLVLTLSLAVTAKLRFRKPALQLT